MNPGAIQVINWFDNNADEQSPYWSLWIGSELMGSVGTGDLDECKDKLLKNLDFIYANPNPGKYRIRLHDDQKDKRINSKTDYYSSHAFYPSAQTAQLSGAAGTEFPSNPGMQAIYNKLVALETDNTAIRAMLAEEEGEGEAGLGQVPANPLITLLNHPRFIESSVDRIMGLVDRFMPEFSPGKDPHRMGSIGQIPGADPLDQHAKLQQAIEILWMHDQTLGDDLMRLARIAENDPEQWKFLLNMLRR